MRTLVTSVLLFCVFGITGAQELKTRSTTVKPAPQTPRALANNDPAYVALRNIQISKEVIPVSGFRLNRDAGIFTFRSGAFYLLEPVNGKITGAVFIGDAAFGVNPPTETERRYLKFLAKDEFVEQFSEAVFRFTDGTEEELRKAAARDATPAAAGDPAALLKEVQHDLKKKLKQNLDVRLLEDVLSSQKGGKFIAFVKGKKYGGKLIFDVDPQGVVSYMPDPPPIFNAGPRIQRSFTLAPEEVALIAWDYDHYGIWTAFHFSKEYADGTANSNEKNSTFNIDHQDLDVSIARNAHLNGLAQTTVTARRDGVRVLPLELFPMLRVQWVAGDDGKPVSFIQEEPEEDSDFAVILPRELKKGETCTISTRYDGKDAVTDEGSGNYYPIARDNWYPSQGFGNYATYDMSLHIPKGMKIAATGKLTRTVDEGKETLTEWTSDAPQAVAGFNFGDFKRQEDQDLSHHYDIEADVNTNSPAMVESYKNAVASGGSLGVGNATGSLSTVPMMKKAVAEAQVALDLYSKYYGDEPYKKLAMTQQTALGYGQSWPGLVFLPLSYFLDSTARHFSMGGNEHGFFKVVGPHEIAHQWWGHMVGWNSYRDQWMSEGFAEMSASIFLQAVYTEHGLDDYHEFWAFQRKLLTDTNGQGKRAIDVGPLTLGYRLATAKTGFNIPRDLIYPKGAYILQMVRFMLQGGSNPKDVDSRFKAMMHDFTTTYANRPATTEDFKAVLEKHMTQEMDLGGNHKMDWFFDEYVYGTEFPKYKFAHSFAAGADGDMVLHFKLSQAGVSDKFRMMVPLYIEMNDGRVMRLGGIRLVGNRALEQDVPLKGLKEKPKRALIAYYDDVLGDIENK